MIKNKNNITKIILIFSKSLFMMQLQNILDKKISNKVTLKQMSKYQKEIAYYNIKDQRGKVIDTYSKVIEIYDKTQF